MNRRSPPTKRGTRRLELLRKSTQRGVKICKIFAPSLDLPRSTVDASCVEFYYYSCVAIALRSYFDADIWCNDLSSVFRADLPQPTRPRIRLTCDMLGADPMTDCQRQQP